MVEIEREGVIPLLCHGSGYYSVKGEGLLFGLNRCNCRSLQVIRTPDLLQGLLFKKGKVQNERCVADVRTMVERYLWWK